MSANFGGPGGTPMCAVHEERLNRMEGAMEKMADSIHKLELLAERAAGFLKFGMLIYPIATGTVTGLVIWALTKR